MLPSTNKNIRQQVYNPVYVLYGDFVYSPLFFSVTEYRTHTNCTRHNTVYNSPGRQHTPEYFFIQNWLGEIG